MARTQRRIRHPILCGTDFTAQAAPAAQVAGRLAAALERPLLLVHVMPPGAHTSGQAVKSPLGKAAADDLRREAARLQDTGAVVVPELHAGHADEVLTTRAREAAAEILVVGALGTRLPTRRFLGSIAERVAEMAPVPTLVVRNAAPFERWLKGQHPLRVFLGFDFTVTAEAAAEWLRVLARCGPCEVTVGHANRPAEDQQRFGVLDRTPAEENSPRLQELLERQLADRVSGLLGETPARVRVEPNRGRVDLALVGMAAESGADVMVVGTHQRRGLARLWTGSVSRGVIGEAPVSVAIVPVLRTREQHRHVPRVTRVLVATDLSADASRAVAYACGVTGSPGVVRIVHVTHPRSIGGGEHEDTLGRSDRHQRHVRELGRRLDALRPDDARALGLETEATVVEGEDPVTGICQEAERFDAQVIVVETRGGGLKRAVLGSVAQGVIARSERPVLVVGPAKA